VRVVLTASAPRFRAESNAQRQADICAERRKFADKKKREERKTKIFGSVRRGFSLLVMMSIVVVAFKHQDEIHRFVTAKLNQFAANEAARQSAFRQSAIGRENDVDKINE
jgi:hypothetical protein